MKTLEYKIESSLDKVIPSVDKILADIRSICGKDDMFFLKLSIEEALVNAVKYGNKLDQSLYASIRCRVFDDRIEVEVEDSGSGFDYKELKDPTSDENLLRASGRGVYLMKKLMDRVDFLQGGKKVVMVKSF